MLPFFTNHTTKALMRRPSRGPCAPSLADVRKVAPKKKTQKSPGVAPQPAASDPHAATAEPPRAPAEEVKLAAASSSAASADVSVTGHVAQPSSPSGAVADDLPFDCLLTILTFLSPIEILKSTSLVSRMWRESCLCNELWEAHVATALVQVSERHARLLSVGYLCGESVARSLLTVSRGCSATKGTVSLPVPSLLMIFYFWVVTAPAKILWFPLVAAPLRSMPHAPPAAAGRFGDLFINHETLAELKQSSFFGFEYAIWLHRDLAAHSFVHARDYVVPTLYTRHLRSWLLGNVALALDSFIVSYGVTHSSKTRYLLGCGGAAADKKEEAAVAGEAPSPIGVEGIIISAIRDIVSFMANAWNSAAESTAADDPCWSIAVQCFEIVGEGVCDAFSTERGDNFRSKGFSSDAALYPDSNDVFGFCESGDGRLSNFRVDSSNQLLAVEQLVERIERVRCVRSAPQKLTTFGAEDLDPSALVLRAFCEARPTPSAAVVRSRITFVEMPGCEKFERQRIRTTLPTHLAGRSTVKSFQCLVDSVLDRCRGERQPRLPIGKNDAPLAQVVRDALGDKARTRWLTHVRPEAWATDDTAMALNVTSRLCRAARTAPHPNITSTM